MALDEKSAVQLLLRLIPECVQLLEREVAHLSSLLAAPVLHKPEAAGEPVVGQPQRLLKVHPLPARCVHQGEQDIPELVNLQNVKGQAKPYQMRQFLKLVEKHNLKLEDE